MFSENALKICLEIISFLPNIDLPAIFQPLLGTLLKFLAQTSGNLPIISNLTFFDKMFLSSHKSN